MQGAAILDFGPPPGTRQAKVFVPIQANSASWGPTVSVWLSGDDPTVDHSTDEHLVENMRVRAAGVGSGGFTIYGEVDWQTYGKWSVKWSWL